MPTRRGFLKQPALGTVAATLAAERAPAAARTIAPEVTWKRRSPRRVSVNIMSGKTLAIGGFRGFRA